MSVGFQVVIFMLVRIFFQLVANGGGMASKGLRAIFFQVTRKFGAGYKPSHTTETIIGYT